MERPDPGGLGREAAIFEPLSASLPAGDHFARPLLLNNVGAAYMAAERRADALRYFRWAHDALAGVAQPDPELACVDKNLAMLTHDDGDREVLARGVWERRRALLGEAHLQTVEALDSYARFVADPARALPLIREVCALYRGRHPRLVAERASCDSYRAFLTELVGDIAGVRRILQDIIELSSTAEDRTTVAWRNLAAGHLALAQRDLGGARVAFTRVTEAYRDEHAWWELMPLRAELALSRVDLASNHREEAKRRYAVALAGFSRATEMGEDAEPRLRIAEMANDRAGNVWPGDATERE